MENGYVDFVVEVGRVSEWEGDYEKWIGRLNVRGMELDW